MTGARIPIVDSGGPRPKLVHIRQRVSAPQTGGVKDGAGAGAGAGDYAWKDWRCAQTATMVMYWYNTITRAVQWTHPKDGIEGEIAQPLTPATEMDEGPAPSC